MAIGAVAAQLAGVHIAVTGRAGWVERGEGRVRVVTLEYGAVLRIDVFRGVAPGALEPRVLAFEFPAGLLVIEFLLGYGPSHHAVIQSVVLGVAAGAIVAAATGLYLRGMIAALLSQAISDFLVAIQAAELRRPRAEDVTPGALQRPIEIAMRLAEWTGRNLREHFTPQACGEP